MIFNNHCAFEAAFNALAWPKSGTAMRTHLIPVGETMALDNIMSLIGSAVPMITFAPISRMPHVAFGAGLVY